MSRDSFELPYKKSNVARALPRRNGTKRTALLTFAAGLRPSPFFEDPSYKKRFCKSLRGYRSRCEYQMLDIRRKIMLDLERFVARETLAADNARAFYLSRQFCARVCVSSRCKIFLPHQLTSTACGKCDRKRDRVCAQN